MEVNDKEWVSWSSGLYYKDDLIDADMDGLSSNDPIYGDCPEEDLDLSIFMGDK